MKFYFQSILACLLWAGPLVCGFVRKVFPSVVRKELLVSDGMNGMALSSFNGGRPRYSSGGREGRSRWGGGSGGRGGGAKYGRPRMDPSAQLRFKRTIKIDPDFQTPVEEMNLSGKSVSFLKDKGFTLMTPVQSQSYSPVYDGDDVVARSRTGTGKTFAFGLPLIEKLVAQGLNEVRNPESLPLILVLEPTRELAMQVAQELGALSRVHRMRVLAIYGGASFGMQERDIRNGVHILVATPGRVLDHISRGTVDLSRVKHVVLDEGDTMLEMGFQKDVESIIKNVKLPGEASRKAASDSLSRQSRFEEPWGGGIAADDDDAEEGFGEEEWETGSGSPTSSPHPDRADKVQMLLFSATMPGWICQLTDKHMRDPVFLDAVQEGETRLAATIKHMAVRLPGLKHRDEGVRSYVEDLILTEGRGGQTIVFTNTKVEADSLVNSNCFGQLKSQVLHGDIGQGSRQATISQFKKGAIDLIVATDVAARGLDIAGVDLVVQTAPPNDADTYVHRSGRTGRAGRNGTSILLFSSQEERSLGMLERALNFKFQRMGPPSPEQLSEASAQLAASKLQKVSSEVLPYFIPHAQELLRSLEEEDEGAAEDGGEGGSAEREEGGQGTDAHVELVARCLAALSNRNSISSRSLLTGHDEFQTLHVKAVFRNGTSPDSIRNWQRLITGIFRRHLEMEEFHFGKMALAWAPAPIPGSGGGGGEVNWGRSVGRGMGGGNMEVLVDLDFETARRVLQLVAERGLPPGVSVEPCSLLPPLVEGTFPSALTDSRSGSRGRYSGGPRAGGNRGGRSFQPRGDTKPWQKSGFNGARHH